MSSNPATKRSIQTSVAQDKARCFVIMPFSPTARFTPIFTHGLLPLTSTFPGWDLTIERLDTRSHRDDPFLGPAVVSVITQHCDFVIVDLSGFRPNVLFELGLAVASQKPFVPIMERSQLALVPRRASDLGGLKVTTYEPRDPSGLTNSLVNPVRQVLDNCKRQHTPPGITSASWEDITSGVLKAVDVVSNAWATVDIVVAVGRGGAICGAMLAGNLGHKPFYVLDRSYPMRLRFRETAVIDHGDVGLKGKNVLVVFSEIQTGATLKEVLKLIGSKKPRDIRTLAFFKSHLAKENSVDHYIYRYRYDGTSVVQPWYLTAQYQPYKEPS